MEIFYIATAVLFLGLILTEVIISTRKQLKLFQGRDSAVSIAFGIGGVIHRLVMKGITLQWYFWLYEFRIFTLDNSAWIWVACFMMNELIYYWFHRLSHERRWLWATHVNHHSSEYLNYTTAARSPFLNTFHHMIFWAPMPLLGFDPVMTLVVESIGFLFAFTQHTTIIPKLGPLEWIINTPSHHRVHHASNEEYLDKNYGNALIIFDRIFGTFKEEKEKPVFGITKNVKSYNLVTVALHEWQQMARDVRGARNFRERWNYVFGRVGWKPSDAPEDAEKTKG
ncbi:MAG: sterol desaturase family protein [Bacteroidota bacterium]